MFPHPDVKGWVNLSCAEEEDHCRVSPGHMRGSGFRLGGGGALAVFEQNTSVSTVMVLKNVS